MSETRGEARRRPERIEGVEESGTGPRAPGADGRAHVRGSVLLVLGRVLSLFIGMATTVILVRALSKAEYGAFEYALTLTAMR